MATITELKWQSLTRAINEIKSPQQFLKRLLYSLHDPKPTETIELSVLSKGREIAPFVRKNGEAIMVGGHAETFQQVEAPNIRIKRPMQASEVFFRRPGNVIFADSAGQMANALQQHVARDMQGMGDLITNSEEYLCSLSLQGAIAYSVSPEANFTITFPKPAANTVTLTTFWDDPDPTLPTPALDFMTAKRIMSDAVSLQPTDAIMGAEASQEFLKLATIQGLLDIRNVNAGTVTFAEQFDEDGVIFLGRFGGIRCWEYARQVSVNGVLTSLIRPKFVEFVTTSSIAEMTLYYGAIADIDAIESGLLQGERFSKSWVQKDPSVRFALVHSRPLPVPRRPGAIVSMKVVSG